jgi:hypothetical protein
LEKHFSLDIDYKKEEEAFALQFGKATLLSSKEGLTKHGGQNKQTILLTIKCFKSLCLKAQTKKASEIHEYYMKLEEVLHEIVEEETDELRVQLEQNKNLILEERKI